MHDCISLSYFVLSCQKSQTCNTAYMKYTCVVLIFCLTNKLKLICSFDKGREISPLGFKTVLSTHWMVGTFRQNSTLAHYTSISIKKIKCLEVNRNQEKPRIRYSNLSEI
jgi:hypothetical protein